MPKPPKAAKLTAAERQIAAGIKKRLRTSRRGESEPSRVYARDRACGAGARCVAVIFESGNVKPVSGAWQLPQDCPSGVERCVSKNSNFLETETRRSG